RALGLLDDITENEQCFAEAVSYNCTPAQLRLLFCHLILEGMALQTIWQNYHELLSKDHINTTNNIQQGENKTLTWIANFLEKHGCNITQVGLPQPPNRIHKITRIQEQFNNYSTLISEKEKMISKLNAKQKDIYDKIIYHIYNNKPLTIFINRRAGRAALNYSGGRTAHSLFRIPVEYNDDGCKCQINPESECAELIQKSSAITWDELPMAQKGNIEAVDILMCNICKCNLPFRGKIFIGAGDFRQVAPVILNGGRTATILESIKSSSLWN
ncbi:14978_t:CDS:2, partial [Cetraspora pellucida]